MHYVWWCSVVLHSLRKRLLRFIRHYHSDKKVPFWLHFATCHVSLSARTSEIQLDIQKFGIPIVKRNENAAGASDRTILGATQRRYRKRHERAGSSLSTLCMVIVREGNTRRNTFLVGGIAPRRLVRGIACEKHALQTNKTRAKG